MNYFAQQKWLKWAFIVLLVLNIAILGLLFKDTFSHKRHPGPFKSPKELLQEAVELTDEQLSTYGTMLDVHRAVAQDIHEQLNSKKIEYFRNLGLESAEEREKQLQDILKLQRKLEDTTYRHFSRLREILSPEQQEKFDEVVPEVLQKMIRGPRGPNNGPPGGPPPRH